MKVGRYVCRVLIGIGLFLMLLGVVGVLKQFLGFSTKDIDLFGLLMGGGFLTLVATGAHFGLEHEEKS